MSGRIEALTPVDGKDTVVVRLGDAEFEVASQVVTALGLEPGLEASWDVRADLERASNRRRAAAQVLRHLRGRPRTGAEVRAHLQGCGHAPDVIEPILGELEARGIVDDRRYAEWFVEARLSHRPMGRLRLVREMRARGIERDLAEEVSCRATQGREAELALAAARPRMVALRRLGRERGMRRLLGFLGRRGFEESTVREVCLRLFASEES